MGARTPRSDSDNSVHRQKIISVDVRSIVSPQKSLANLPQDVLEDFDDEELAWYAEEITRSELEEAADESFDLSDWDGIDDIALAAALEDQQMQM